MPEFVSSGTARLAVDVAGDGPGVVFLHAGVTDRRSWHGVVDLLPGVRAVAYDRRGFGETTYEAEPHADVDDLLAVLDATGVDVAVLVGSSMGGRLAVDATLAHPERVAGLVLIGAGVSGFDADVPEAALEADIEAADEAGDLDRVNRLEAWLWLDGPGAGEGRVGGAVRDLFLDMNGRALAAAPVGELHRPLPAAARLTEVTVPVVVVVGDLDEEHARAAGAFLAEGIRGAELRRLPGVAHLPQLERPDVVAEAVRRVLARVD